MKATSNSDGPSRDDAVTRELLLLADRQEIQPPPDVLDRVRARLHENTARSPSIAPARARAPEAKRAWFAAAGAAAVVLIALLFCLRPSRIAWSQVVEAVRAMPWIHLTAVSGEGQSREAWLSYSRSIGAMRDGAALRFDDYRSGIRYEYDLQQRKLYRLSASGEGSFKAMEEIFQAIFRGDAALGENFDQHPIVKQRQRTLSEQGRRWTLYELELEGPDSNNNNDPNSTYSLQIRVDPQRRLPELMTFTRGKEQVQWTIDYPDEGPADIYALGVPRDAPVEDRTPAPDLSRILKLVEQNRRDFGDYLAVAGGTNIFRPFSVHVIRCKGDKFRVDVGIGDTTQVASGTEMEKWWREHGKEILPDGSVLCDGRRVYERRPETGWKPTRDNIRQGDARAAAVGVGRSAQYFVDLLAYPTGLSSEELASTPSVTVRLDAKGENGPTESVRVERLIAKSGGATDRRTYHKEEFWLQPKYGYAVVKRVFSDCPEVDEDPLRTEKHLIYEYDDFRQTPSGIWYPTVSRWKNASSSENRNTPGGIEFHDQVTYFYLDFTADFPDALFSPEWQGDLLSDITFAREDEAPTSKNLGKIRPPGGVPLRIVGPDGKYNVDGLHRVSKRLEAVPRINLENWVIELERIMGKKLKDGVPSPRQACRTDFVIHMSVAFDDLKWNAKTADDLFQRAQSMPASEAKLWKEAFEVLLNKEIGQTDTSNHDGGPAWAVPLVIIPVDALHEGQKYRVERGKKYRARLKQLTADDVSLWKDQVDECGGTELDAAVNIMLLDDYFKKGTFQRDKFQAAVEARKK